jgi:hypothetical protein
MDMSKFDVILDASDDDFAEKLRAALGLKPGEPLNIITPQFQRTDGRIITYIPSTPAEYAAIKTMDSETLKKIGCQVWDKSDRQTHWLFPGEWYAHIPAGTEIVDINGQTEPFEPGVTDDDIRFGALAYGFVQPHN